MVLDPIPQSLSIHFFGSRPQPPTSHLNAVHNVRNRKGGLLFYSQKWGRHSSILDSDMLLCSVVYIRVGCRTQCDKYGRLFPMLNSDVLLYTVLQIRFGCSAHCYKQNRWSAILDPGLLHNLMAYISFTCSNRHYKWGRYSFMVRVQIYVGCENIGAGIECVNMVCVLIQILDVCTLFIYCRTDTIRMYNFFERRFYRIVSYVLLWGGFDQQAP